MSTGQDDSGNDVTDDSSGSGGGGKAFKFTIVDGNVTQVFEVKDGVDEPKPIDDDGSESYTVESGEVVRKEINAFGTEFTRYADFDEDGIYNRISESWQGNDDSPGPHFRHNGDLNYLSTEGDDSMAVRAGEDCSGGQGADDFYIREAGDLRIGDFKSSEDNSIIFDTGFGLTSKDELQGYVSEVHYEGDDLIVAFVNNVATITLVGVGADVSWDDVQVLS